MTDNPDRSKTHPTSPPESWTRANRLARSVQGSLESFLHVEAAGGIVLVMAAVIALMWANSPWGDSYSALWHTHIAIGVGDWRFDRDLHFWVNDLLMTIFFLVVGLEIKRELVEGALSDIRRATLPVVAAIGGMLVPAAIYLAINPTYPAHEGWGVPMATDIAFAIGVLGLLGKRIPATLRVLILAIAIIDDIGAILVIALFYAEGFAIDGLAVAGVGLALLFLLLKIGVRPGFIFILPILIMWVGMLNAGIHPTIAGVIAGLIAPAKSWYGKEGFLKASRDILDDFQSRIDKEHEDHELFEPLTRLSKARKEALSPALRMELALHPWVAYVIMPLFAIANAGVDLRGIDLQAPSFLTISAGVILGLVVGKPLGIMLLSWIAVRLKLCSLPDGVNWRGMFVVGAGAGIGFTMAIFIAELAFTDMAMLRIAKLSILVATATAATVALAFGRLLLTTKQTQVMAQATLADVESDPEFWTGNHATPAAAKQRPNP